MADSQREQVYQDRVKELETSQKAYFCRLFADAFATYFIGPAYIHALLNLEFMPAAIHHDAPKKPPVQDRIVVALEILSWMNNERTSDVKDNNSLFARELGKNEDQNNPQGFYKLRQLALKSAQEPGDYDELKTKYKNWIDLFKNILGDKKYIVPWKTTYQNWKTALEIEDALVQKDMKLSIKPSHWAVVNAAWSARWLYKSEVSDIHDNALWLLNLHQGPAPGWYEPPTETKLAQGRLQSPIIGHEAWSREDAIANITRYLVTLEDDSNFLKFSRMKKNNVFTSDQDIRIALSDEPDRLADFKKLCNQ
jgi:hypothetical protein